MAVSQEKASSAAITSLVLGILSLVCGCGLLLGIPAWIIGKGEIAKIDAGQSSAAGRTLAQVGMILGMIATGLSVLWLIWVFALGGMAMLSGMSGGMSPGGVPAPQ